MCLSRYSFLLAELKEYGEVYLFGSVACNTHTEASDVDLAVITSDERLPSIKAIIGRTSDMLPVSFQVNQGYSIDKNPSIKLDLNVFTENASWESFKSYPHQNLLAL